MRMQAQYQGPDHAEPITLIGLVAPRPPHASSSVEDTPERLSDSSPHTSSNFRGPDSFFVMRGKNMV